VNYDLAVAFLVGMTVVLLVIPLVGGSMVWFGHRLARIGELTHAQCWRAFLIAFAYANILLIVASWLMIFLPTAPQEVLVGVGLVLLCGATIAIQAFVLGSYTRPSLAIQTGAVVAAVGLMLALFVVISKLRGGG
jgi:hypothetical protein